MIIRKYKPSDRSQVEFIQFETYFMGKSGSNLAVNQREFNKEIKYYLDKEPETCFVVEDKGKVVGYLLGCLDDNKFHESALGYFFEHLKKLIKTPFMHSRDRKFWLSKFKFLLRAMFGKSKEMKLKHPENAGHLHINFLPQARGHGVGTKLLKVFFKYAKSMKVKTIHADSFQTGLNPNKNFWIKNGFKEYSKIKTSFWQEYYPTEEIFVVCYVKKL